MRWAASPSQRPVVGSAWNWQGQPQAQLQPATPSPTRRQGVFALTTPAEVAAGARLRFESAHVGVVPAAAAWRKVDARHAERTYEATAGHLKAIALGIAEDA